LTPTQKLPTDTIAERACVGCCLQGCWDEDLDLHPEWWTCERLGLLYLSIRTLRDEGELPVPRSGHPGDVLAAARGGAELAAHMLDKSELWQYPIPVRAELNRCITEATLPELMDVYVRRMREVFEQRREITEAERKLKHAWEGRRTA
jgi:hypothetical protein